MPTKTRLKRWNGSAYEEVDPKTSWDQVTDKPTEFEPEDHTHMGEDIIDGDFTNISSITLPSGSMAVNGSDTSFTFNVLETSGGNSRIPVSIRNGSTSSSTATGIDLINSTATDPAHHRARIEAVRTNAGSAGAHDLKFAVSNGSGMQDRLTIKHDGDILAGTDKLATEAYVDDAVIADTNNYVNSISGDGNSTLTLGRLGLSNLTQDLSHTHSISEINDLQSELDGKSDTGHGHTAGDISGLATVATSGSYNDLSNTPSIPNSRLASSSSTGYLAYQGHTTSPSGGALYGGSTNPTSSTSSTRVNFNGPFRATQLWEGGTRVSVDGHSHSISDVTDLQTELDGKSDTGHGHSISDITNLQSELDGKSDTGHGHTASDVSGLASIATSGSASHLSTGFVPISRGRRGNSTSTGVPQYNGNTRSPGRFYTGTTSPADQSSSYRMNYDGIFRASQLHEGSSRVATQNYVGDLSQTVASSDIGYVAYNGTDKATGKFYGGGGTPDSTSSSHILNYDGVFRAGQVREGSSRLTRGNWEIQKNGSDGSGIINFKT